MAPQGTAGCFGVEICLSPVYPILVSGEFIHALKEGATNWRLGRLGAVTCYPRCHNNKYSTCVCVLGWVYTKLEALTVLPPTFSKVQCTTIEVQFPVSVKFHISNNVIIVCIFLCLDMYACMCVCSWMYGVLLQLIITFSYFFIWHCQTQCKLRHWKNLH